ncbi:hypothetical protein MRB56_14160 [Halomonas cupida]|uniref:hypothetical protein n=1 Tax=Halomonas cupida TaxID=44933 RepID=UPI0039B65ABC
MSQRNDKSRPAVLPPASAALEEITEFIQWRQSQPLSKASNKVYDFVNDCVTDPNFLHPQSATLLDVMMLLRDVLIDGINEEWDLDDVLEPIMVQARRIVAEKQAAPMIKHQRDTAARLQERNAQIVLRVEALKKAGVSSVMKVVAKEFDMEVKTVRNICSKQKLNKNNTL